VQTNSLGNIAGSNIAWPELLSSVYVIASIAYLVVMFLLWQMKRDYDRFIATRESKPAA
jgi:hypothetical protein